MLTSKSPQMKVRMVAKRDRQSTSDCRYPLCKDDEGWSTDQEGRKKKPSRAVLNAWPDGLAQIWSGALKKASPCRTTDMAVSLECMSLSTKYGFDNPLSTIS